MLFLVGAAVACEASTLTEQVFPESCSHLLWVVARIKGIFFPHDPEVLLRRIMGVNGSF